MISVDIHTIAAIKAADKYTDLAEGFKNVFSAINSHIQNPIITINSVEYTLEFFLCADYKVAISSYSYVVVIISLYLIVFAGSYGA